MKNRIQLDEIINSTFLKFKRDEIIKKMTKAQIAFGKLSSIEDLTNHPQSIFVEIKTSEGKIKLLSPAAIINGEEKSFGKVPDLGEHNNHIKNEFK